MLGIERKMMILDILKKDRSVSVVKLAKTLYTSEATIRRDLDQLEKEQLIKRTYGGAALLEGLSAEIPLYVRETERQKEKDAIALAAANLVADGNILIMDSSSTTYGMVRFLAARKDLTVLTNGAKTAIKLGELHTRVFCTGGQLRENSLSYVGDSAVAFIQGYHADVLFFSCRGLVDGEGLYESSPEEAQLRRAMMRSAQTKVLLCDNSKLGSYSFNKICPLEEIDVLVCNASVDENTRRWVAEAGVRLIETV